MSGESKPVRRPRPSPELIRDAIRGIIMAGFKPGRLDVTPDGGLSVAIMGEAEGKPNGDGPNEWDKAA